VGDPVVHERRRQPHGQVRLLPKLQRRSGEKVGGGTLFGSPFTFWQHGQCGRWVSSAFPHQARHVDDLAFLRAMNTDNRIHGLSSYMLNTGFALAGYPCMGSWVSFGLGRLSENLSAFVVLPDIGVFQPSTQALWQATQCFLTNGSTCVPNRSGANGSAAAERLPQSGSATSRKIQRIVRPLKKSTAT